VVLLLPEKYILFERLKKRISFKKMKRRIKKIGKLFFKL